MLESLILKISVTYLLIIFIDIVLSNFLSLKKKKKKKKVKSYLEQHLKFTSTMPLIF